MAARTWCSCIHSRLKTGCMLLGLNWLPPSHPVREAMPPTFKMELPISITKAPQVFTQSRHFFIDIPQLLFFLGHFDRTWLQNFPSYPAARDPEKKNRIYSKKRK